MITRRGVTLIELLIVITIIAILSGAALPYVQQYLDDSKQSRCKQDLDEIKGALARYEVARGQEYPDTNTGIASLVGPYLSKMLIDPWGAPYLVYGASSTVLSRGPDGVDNSGDEVIVEFRPPMAVSDVFWVDTNNDGQVGAGDSLNLKVTRPGKLPGTLAAADFTVSSGWAVAISGAAWVQNGRVASYGLSGSPVFQAGKDTVTIAVNNNLIDGNNGKARQDTQKIKAR